MGYTTSGHPEHRTGGSGRRGQDLAAGNAAAAGRRDPQRAAACSAAPRCRISIRRRSACSTPSTPPSAASTTSGCTSTSSTRPAIRTSSARRCRCSRRSRPWPIVVSAVERRRHAHAAAHGVCARARAVPPRHRQQDRQPRCALRRSAGSSCAKRSAPNACRSTCPPAAVTAVVDCFFQPQRPRHRTSPPSRRRTRRSSTRSSRWTSSSWRCTWSRARSCPRSNCTTLLSRPCARATWFRSVSSPPKTGAGRRRAAADLRAPHAQSGRGQPAAFPQGRGRRARSACRSRRTRTNT